MVLEREMRREPQISSISVPRFRRGGGILNHTGGAYSHSGMIDYPRFPIRELHQGTCPETVEFEAAKSTSKLQYVLKQQIFVSQCTGSKKWRLQSQSRSIMERTDFSDDDMLAMIAFCTEIASQHAHSLPKKSKCRRATRSKMRPILTRKTNCLHDLRASSCNCSL